MVGTYYNLLAFHYYDIVCDRKSGKRIRRNENKFMMRLQFKVYAYMNYILVAFLPRRVKDVAGA